MLMVEENGQSGLDDHPSFSESSTSPSWLMVEDSDDWFMLSSSFIDSRFVGSHCIICFDLMAN